MYTNVKKYRDNEIWNKIISLGGRFPEKGKVHFVVIESNEDTPNKFDDKCYTFIGRGRDKMPKFYGVSSCTANPGKKGLLNFWKYNNKGVFIWKTNENYEDVFEAGYHKGRMKAWRLIKPVKYYRDGNRNLKSEEIGKVYYGNKNTNMHTVSYNPLSNFIKKYINGWSLGCIVWNNTKDYYKMIKDLWRPGRKANLSILKEW